MRVIFPLFFYCILSTFSEAQVVSGRVIDANSKEALEYVSLGILNTRIGSISDENGDFRIELGNLPPSHVLRFSMIAYESQTFTLGDLSENQQLI